MLKNIGLIVLNLVIIILIVLGATLWWLPNWLNDITGHDQRVIVPEVLGMTADKAEAALDSVGLRVMVIDTVYSDGSLPGEVIEQLPEGNLPVKPNRIVYLTVNAYDAQQIIFPDVIQWSSRQAQSHLRELRFVADSIVYVPYEFDDLVLKVTTGRKEMVIGESYPLRTHLILHVGSTKMALKAENEKTEESFFQ